MTPKVKSFENVSGFRDGTPNYVLCQVWWKSAVEKLPKGRLVYHTKNSRCRTRPSPHFAPNGRSHPKFPKCCHPLICPRIPNLVRIGCVLPDLFRKYWFFGPKSHKVSAYNNNLSSLYTLVIVVSPKAQFLAFYSVMYTTPLSTLISFLFWNHYLYEMTHNSSSSSIHQNSTLISLTCKMPKCSTTGLFLEDCKSHSRLF